MQQSLYLFPNFFTFLNQSLCIAIFLSRSYHFTSSEQRAKSVEKFRDSTRNILRQHFSTPAPPDLDFQDLALWRFSFFGSRSVLFKTGPVFQAHRRALLLFWPKKCGHFWPKKCSHFYFLPFFASRKMCSANCAGYRFRVIFPHSDRIFVN